MSNDTPKKSVGRPLKNVDNTQADKWNETASSEEAAQAITYNKEKRRQKFIKDGKKSTIVIGYEYRPYYNRPKKQHLAKVIIVERNQLRDIVCRRLIARNVNIDKAIGLQGIRNLEELKIEHKKRSRQQNYGL